MHRPLSCVLICCLSAAATLSVAPDAQAQQLSDEQRARADALYNEGAKLFVEKKYSAAILRFRNSYKIDSSPKTLYNIALCHGRLGQYTEAVDVAKRASQALGAPDALRNKATARLRGFERAERATRVAKAIGDPTVAKAPPKEIVQPPSPSPEGGFGLLGWAGVGTSVVGAGLLAGALVLNAGLGDEIDEYEESAKTDPNPPRDSARFDDITSRQTTGKILLFSGAGLAAAGITMVLIDALSDSDTPAPQARVTPLLAPRRDGAWAGLRIGF